MRNYLLFCWIFFAAMAWTQQEPPPASGTQAIYNAAARSAQRKFDRIQQNALLPTPDQTPTPLSENEINAWLSSGRAQLPQGVKKVQFRGEPDVIHATAYVDFDEITAGRKSGNPLLGLFRGTHEVEATAHAQGRGGMGQIHIDTVFLDGVEVPRMALEFFVEKYLKPKHPEIGLDTAFKLPYRIDTGTVGPHNLVVTQK